MPKVTSGTHNYNVFGTSGSGNVKIIDTATPFLKYLAANFPNEFKRALKSAGWWLSSEIKAGIRSGAPGGQAYKPLSGISNIRMKAARTKIKKMGKRGKLILKGATHQRNNILARDTRVKKPLIKMAPAIGYKYYEDSNRVLVGWLSKSAQKLGELQERGFAIDVTQKVRNLYFGSNSEDRYRKLFPTVGSFSNPEIYIGKKRQIIVPARPTIDPMYRTRGPKVASYIENKIFEVIRKAEAKTA